MAIGDSFLANPNEQRALVNPNPAGIPAVNTVPTPVPAVTPQADTSKLGEFFANRPTENLQLASILGQLAGAVGGPAGNVGGAFGKIAQQGIAGKNVGTLSQGKEATLTAPDQDGDTTETVKHNADGTYTRTLTGLDTSRAPAGGSPGTAFAPPVQRPFNPPTEAPKPITLEGLSGLPVAVQLQLLEQQRAGEAQQANEEAQQAQTQLAQQKQNFAESNNPVRQTIAGGDGQYYHILNDGTMQPSGVKVPKKLQPVTSPSGPGGQKSTAAFDPTTGTVGAAFATGAPQATGGLTDAQQAEGPIKLQKEVRAASTTTNKKGKKIPKSVTTRDVTAFNETAKRFDLPYRYTKVKFSFDPIGPTKVKGDFLFRTDVNGNVTDTDVIKQLVSDYDVSEKDALKALKDARKRSGQ